MKKWLQWMIFSTALVFSTALLVIGLLAGGVALMVQALIALLMPITGAAGAYAISGGACLGSVVLLCFIMVLWLRKAHKVASAGGEPSLPDPYQSARAIMQAYPLETVLAAFVVGLTATDLDQVKKVATEVLREV